MSTAQNKIELQFTAPGSLPRPGPVGRIIRLAIGVWLLAALYSLLAGASAVMSLERLPRNLTFWLYVLIAFHITPYVINIGFGKNWRHGTQFAVGAAAAVLLAIDLVAFGRIWAPPLAAFVLIWLVYFSLHLGGSFVLSALLGTPGCEMRSLPHLWARLRGREIHEHYCPGPFDGLDRWETRRSPKME